MTKLDPITSEEVLERQVKEQAKLRPQPSIPNQQPTNNDAGATAEKNVKSDDEAVRTRVKSNVDRAGVETGFLYRMPLGSYLLSFLYLQIFVIVACSILFTILISLQNDYAVGQSLLSVQRETWGMLVISIVFSFFLFSGNNILRLFTMGGRHYSR